MKKTIHVFYEASGIPNKKEKQLFDYLSTIAKNKGGHMEYVVPIERVIPLIISSKNKRKVKR